MGDPAGGGVAPFGIIRPARNFAASTNVGSFISARACMGVFVRDRFTVQVSRNGASKASIAGCGTDRFQ